MSKIENNASGTPDSSATQSVIGQSAVDSGVSDYTSEFLCSSAQGTVLKNYLVLRFSIVLVALAILAMGVYWINLKIIDTDSSNAAAINQSGKQRLNTLRIAFSALLVSKAVNEKQREAAGDMLMKAATAMEKGHDELTLRHDGSIPPSRYTSGWPLSTMRLLTILTNARDSISCVRLNWRPNRGQKSLQPMIPT